jgi:hypothetical protein
MFLTAFGRVMERALCGGEVEARYPEAFVLRASELLPAGPQSDDERDSCSSPFPLESGSLRRTSSTKILACWD